MLVLLQLAGTIASLYLPSLNAKIIDEGVAVGDTGFIVRTGGWMLAISLVQVVATIAATYLGARSSALMGRDLRQSLFDRVGTFSAQEVTRFGAPTLISRTTNDVTQVQMVTNMGLTMLVSAPIMMVGGIIMAVREDLGLSWLVAVAVPVLVLSVAAVISRMIPQFRVMQKSVDWVNRVLREQITGVRVVRAFVREPHEEARFNEANDQYTGTALAVGRLMALAFPIVMLVFNASTVAVLWFGAARVGNGQMQVGALTAFMSYLMQILMSVMMATFMSMMIPRAAVSSGRIDEVLRTDSSVRVPDRPEAIPGGPVTVEARGVSFHYPGADVPVLHDVSFTARARHHHRRHRVHGLGQDHVGQPGAAAVRRHGRVAARRRRRRPRGRPRRPVGPDGPGAAAAVPVLGHGREQPALRQARRHRRRAVGGAAHLAGRGLRPRDAARARRADRAGRDERLGRSAPAAGDRPRRRAPAGGVPVRRLVLGPRPVHRRAAALGARAGDARTRR